MNELTSSVLLDGLKFPECPRWRDGRLWFSDVQAHKIIAVTPDGKRETILEHDGLPAGLGWLPDGTLLFVSMVDRKLMCVVDGGVGVVADLSALEGVQLNDMIVDAQGRAYIGGFGFDINRGDPPALSSVYVVSDEQASIAAPDMRFPNGMVITPDGRTLIVAETTARCLTAFDIADDGGLSNRHTWAKLETFPDGICLDAEGAVWVAAPATGDCRRVLEGGEVTDVVRTPDKGVYACSLGGDDGRTLFLCTAKTSGPELVEGKSTGWLETAPVNVPWGGSP
ncbi:MAG TPA: SMP-30/gluconolactonase/LRE family protein [Dehalococcoidia bacterium]